MLCRLVQWWRRGGRGGGETSKDDGVGTAVAASATTAVFSFVERMARGGIELSFQSMFTSSISYLPFLYICVRCRMYVAHVCRMCTYSMYGMDGDAVQSKYFA